MKFQFIEDYKQEYVVKMMCRVLEVSEGGYSAWRNREKSERDKRNEELIEQIRQTDEDNRRSYGSPRIHVELRDQGITCSRKRVARLMRVAGISAKPKRRRICTTDSKHRDPVAQNQLNREFQAREPNTRWAGDITGLETAAGWLYLAVI